MAKGTSLGSVDRALQLLSVLQSGETLTVTGAARALDVVPSTAHRLLGALVHRGYAVQNEDRCYRAGPALRSHQPAITVGALSAAAAPILAELHTDFDETVHVMVLQQRWIRFVDGIESSKALRVSVRSRDLMPAHCSAGGKAMLAHLSRRELDERYREGLPEWPSARVRSLKALHRDLETVRRRGYGLNIEETEPGVSGVAAAVLTPAGRPVAAITLAVPSSRFGAEEQKAAGQAAAESADRLTAALRQGL